MQTSIFRIKLSPRLSSICSRFKQIFLNLKPIYLPLTMAVFPPLFHYANNANILLLPSLFRMIIFFLIFSIIIFLLFSVFTRYKFLPAANATAVFLIFFNTYGIAYTFLRSLDIFLVEHYILFPIYFLLSVYCCWLITKIKGIYPKSLWKVGVFLFGVLLLFNTIRIIPAEIAKVKNASQNRPLIAESNIFEKTDLPDIYYVIFDEFSGFEPMRSYWNYQGVNEFKQYLENKGFFVAEDSHASTIDTLHEMATRLNYQEYPITPGSQREWMNAIADNNVMRYLKSIGYSTVTFDETQFAYESMPQIISDYSYTDDKNMSSGIVVFDEFGTLIADNTMLRIASKLYKINNPIFSQHRNMIYFTVDNIAEIKEVNSPKFVHAHLMYPHFPFLFTENGNLIDPQFYYDWNYYLGNYKYSIKLAERMIDNILSASDPNRPPVIILQSDHGVRNQKTGSPDSVVLEDYPEEYKTSILFAMYIPGYDYSTIPQDIDPINTFPIIFNYLFNTQIQLK